MFDPKECETRCYNDKDCKYFVHNAYPYERTCKIYLSANRTCNLIRGPPNPSLEDCSSIATAAKIKRKFELFHKPNPT